MRMTIVVQDGVVGIDGEFRRIDGLAALVQAGIRAVQWYGDRGEIEFADGAPNDVVQADYMATLQPVVDAWNALTPPPLTMEELLAKAKADRLAYIDAAYTGESEAHIAYLGHEFQADSDSQALIVKTIAASGGALPAGFVWYDAQNLPVVMSYADLQGLAAAILARAQPLFVKKQTLKEAIRKASNETDVGLITW